MLIIHVHLRVKPEFVEQFREATLLNAQSSVQEPGIARFDVAQDNADPTQFVLVEAYRVAGAREQHRATAHYQLWRDTVEPMMAEPRSGTQYTNVFPADEAW